MSSELEPTLPLSRRALVFRIAAIILVVAGIVLGIASLLNPGPRESNRVTHPAGFSIIKPEDWDARIVADPSGANRNEAITLSPKSWQGPEPSIWVRRIVPPDLVKLRADGYSQQPFQSRAAWINERRPKRHRIREAIFRDGEEWFSVGVSLPGTEGLNVDKWWRYAQSFRNQASRSLDQAK